MEKTLQYSKTMCEQITNLAGIKVGEREKKELEGAFLLQRTGETILISCVRRQN